MFMLLIRLCRVGLLLFTFALFCEPVEVSAQQQVPPELEQAQRYFQQGAYEEVIELLDPAAHGHLASVPAFRLLTSAYMQAGEAEKALETARAGQEWFPKSIDLQLLVIDALRLTNPEEAVRKMDALAADLEAGFIRSETVEPAQLSRFHAGVLLSAGNEALQQNNPEQAVVYFEQAAARYADDITIYHHLFYAWLQMEEFRKIADYFDTLPDRFMDDEMLLTLRNQALLEEGETDALTEQLERRYHENPDDVDTAIVYGQLLLNQNRLNEANELFSGLLSNHPERREVYEVLLELNRRQMNLEGVASLLEQKTEYFPDDDALWLELARIRGRQQRYEDAIGIYDEIITRFGPYYAYIQEKAALLKEKDGPDAALELIMHTDYNQNGDAARNFDAGRIYFENARYEEAVSVFEDYTRAYPEDSLGWMMLGRSQIKVKNFKDGLLNFERSAESGAYWPELELVRYKLHHTENFADSLYSALKKSTQEINERREMLEMRVQFAFRGAVEAEPMPFFTLEEQILEWMEAVERLFDFGADRLEMEETTSVLRRLTESMPDEAIFQKMKAGLYEEHGAPDKAFERYKMAAEMDPGDADVHVSAGEILEQLGRTQEAVIWYERALSTRPDARIYRLLIRVHREAGTLDQLIDRWMIRYEAGGTDRLFREYLIDALHRAGRSREAGEISKNL